MEFLDPSPFERIVSRAFGVLVGLGLGLRHNYLLQVRGRRTGRVHATPVNVLDLSGRRFLVAGRGRTQRVRNAEVAGEVVLAKGASRQRLALRRLRAAPVPRQRTRTVTTNTSAGAVSSPPARRAPWR